MGEIKTDSLEEKDRKADDQTGKFTEHDNVGEPLRKETTDEVSEGMPEKDQENLHKVTKTD